MDDDNCLAILFRRKQQLQEAESTLREQEDELSVLRAQVHAQAV